MANIIIRIRGAAVCYSPELCCHFSADYPGFDTSLLHKLNGSLT